MTSSNAKRTAARARRTSKESGFTLIELLVVLAIIGLLASLSAPRVLKYLGGAKSQTAEVRLRTLSTALDLFRLETGRYPTSQEGLDALLAPPASMPNWNGPYVSRPDELLDPWERPFQYQSPGRNGAYDLASLGADGTEGGDGENRDVVSW
jgi:general secretion pathway protein G